MDGWIRSNQTLSGGDPLSLDGQALWNSQALPLAMPGSPP